MENINGEIWLQVENYENLYTVSNLGRIKSLARNVKNKDTCLGFYNKKKDS